MFNTLDGIISDFKRKIGRLETLQEENKDSIELKENKIEELENKKAALLKENEKAKEISGKLKELIGE